MGTDNRDLSQFKNWVAKWLFGMA